MRVFHLERTEDVSGTSGTGTVAEGIEFTSGWIALTWLSPFVTVAVYPSIAALEGVHGHDGKTKVVFDGTVTREAPKQPRKKRTKGDV